MAEEKKVEKAEEKGKEGKGRERKQYGIPGCRANIPTMRDIKTAFDC